MSKTARRLFRYRTLLATLTGRELRARYRGSFLGWAWSLVNPVVLLAVYTFVFGYVFEPKDSLITPYSLFLITGLFPWIWVQSSLMEGTASVIANAGLIKKATFPSELLPIVPVLANLVHFALTLPVIAAAFLGARFLGFPVGGVSALLLPAIVLLQLPLVAGCALALAALNAHFKDVKDLLSNVLTILFFMTPILYSMRMVEAYPAVRAVVLANPITPFTLAYHQALFHGQVPALGLWLQMATIGLVGWVLGTAIYERLRDTLVEAI